MKDSEYFLSGQIFVIDQFKKQMEIEMVKPIFRFLEYRNKYEDWKSNSFERMFRELHVFEQAMRFYTLRWSFDIGIWYETTDSKTRKKIRSNIKGAIGTLRYLIKRERVIEAIEFNNSNVTVRFEEGTGELRKSYFARDPKDKFDMAILKSNYFNEYLELLNRTVESIESQMTGFTKNKKRVPNKSVFIPKRIKDFFKDYDDLDTICDYLCEERPFPDNDDHIVISYKAKKYHWLGIGRNKIPLLAVFINDLKGHSIIDFEYNDSVSRAFIKHFNVKLGVDGFKRLSKYIAKPPSKYKDFFTKNIEAALA